MSLLDEKARGEWTHEIVERLYARHPEWLARWGARGKEATTRDVGHTLRFLEAGFPEDAEAVFPTYIAWLGSILRERNVPSHTIVSMIDVIHQTAAAHLGDALAATARARLDAGRAAIDAPPPVPGRRALEVDEALAGVLEALLAGDRRRVEATLQRVARRMDVGDVADRLVQPAMTEIGRLWQEHRISVAEEHLATAIMQTAMARIIALDEPAAASDKRAVVACVQGNHHSLGARLIADALEHAGWDVRYLGADVPSGDLVALVGVWKPQWVGLSLSLPEHVVSARQAVDAIRRSAVDPAPRIVVGGLPLNDFEGLANVIGADEYRAGASAIGEVS